MGQLIFCNVPPKEASTARPSRMRAWHSKTRSGCDICRQRRIKCDETRPICQRCQKKGRSCTWTTLKANIFEPASVAREKITPGTALTTLCAPSDQRALKFFIEETGPNMAAYQDHTKTFWQTIVPQLAESEVAVRHMTIALASRQERRSGSSTSGVHEQALQKLERDHFALGLSNLTRSSTRGDVQTLLVASVLFVAYGSLEDTEEQTAQELEHFSGGLKILLERARNAGETQKASEIIDLWIKPMLVRLELVYSMFMPPRTSTGYAVVVEPEQPILPLQFPSILAARQSFLEICAYRYHKDVRSAEWNFGAAGFRRTRQLMLDWYKLVIKYKDSLGRMSDYEQQRVTVMLSQFRVLFIALTYSARTDLHSIEDHLRPTVVALLKRDQINLQYDLPERYMQQLPGLDWESQHNLDPLQVRLWPVSQVTGVKENSGSLSLTFYV